MHTYPITTYDQAYAFLEMLINETSGQYKPSKGLHELMHPIYIDEPLYEPHQISQREERIRECESILSDVEQTVKTIKATLAQSPAPRSYYLILYRDGTQSVAWLNKLALKYMTNRIDYNRIQETLPLGENWEEVETKL